MRKFVVPVAALLLLLFPLVATALDRPFYITLVTRMLILGLAASSLNLILGYGGLVSFGHAAFFGLGGYVVGILALNGWQSAWIAWPFAVTVTALVGLLIGAISLRTRNVYFIMITLAFAQMLFFFFTSLRVWGGQDGIRFDRSTVGVGIDLVDNITFYYVTLAILAFGLLLLHRLLHARFGHALRSIKSNESRMAAIGYPVYGITLIAFTIAAALAGLAGVLNANLNTFISPASLSWPLSGQLMMMVILGGVGHFWAGVIGAALFLLLETVLAGYTIYWQFGLGAILLFMVLKVLR
ncbi:MAG TPA: branched-chain amino acid ABC transporter permease [Caldilineaceae bacterium]|nr:branched-chain amino acid ABC transporter permease [Caldilineaceae bacterium]